MPGLPATTTAEHSSPWWARAAPVTTEPKLWATTVRFWVRRNGSDRTNPASPSAAVRSSSSHATVSAAATATSAGSS